MEPNSENTDVLSREDQRRRHLFTSFGIIALVLLLLGVLYKGLHLDTTKVPSALINKPAHDFSVASLQGSENWPFDVSKNISLKPFLGKPIVLNFFASWCYSCRAEARDLEAFWQKHKDQGIAVIGIAIQDSPENALEFARSFGKTYLIGLDGNGKASFDYGVSGVPETFFINKNGVIKHKEAGPVDPEMLEKFVPVITSNQ